MSNCFIILAAGKSKRFNYKIPKAYCFYKGKTLIQHSIDKAKKSEKFKLIVLVINKYHKKYIKKLKIKDVKIIEGGKTRAESTYRALNKIKGLRISNVLIHDAARPNFSLKLVNKLINGLKTNKAVVPFCRPTDSIKYKYKKNTYNLIRDNTLLTQTPQAFKYKNLYLISKKSNKKVSDEASLFIQMNQKVKFIKSENTNYKITYEKDIINQKNTYGIGFDVHRLVPNRKLYLGGLKIKSKLGTLGHSDGDPVLHAITDSILGACQMGDIGKKFSNKNKKFKNIRSAFLLKKVINEIKFKNYYINNLDVNIITQFPKIQKYKNKMTKVISKICEISESQINIKGKTTEKLGVIGKEKAIACEVIASVVKYD